MSWKNCVMPPSLLVVPSVVDFMEVQPSRQGHHHLHLGGRRPQEVEQGSRGSC